jgi:hypothetical protein
MEIERLWGQTPGWFSTQPRDTQVRLLAWMRLTTDPKGEHFKPKRKRR